MGGWRVTENSAIDRLACLRARKSSDNFVFLGSDGAPAAAGYGTAAADNFAGYNEYANTADANGGYETYSEYPADTGAAGSS